MRPQSFIPSILGGGGASGALIDILRNLELASNLRLCLDAGDSNSYPGSGQTWFDVSGNGGNFNRASSSGSGPAFNGSAGNLSENEYFSFSGSNNFDYSEVVVPNWARRIPNNNAEFSLGCLTYQVGQSTVNTVLGIGDVFGGEESFVFLQMGVSSSEYEYVTLVAQNLSTVLEVNSVHLSAVGSGWDFAGLSINESSSSGGFFYRNGNYLQSEDLSNTFDPTYTNPGFVAATEFKIGTSGLGYADANSRIALLFVIEGTTLSKADFDNIYANIKEARPGFNLP